MKCLFFPLSLDVLHELLELLRDGDGGQRELLGLAAPRQRRDHRVDTVVVLDHLVRQCLVDVALLNL